MSKVSYKIYVNDLQKKKEKNDASNLFVFLLLLGKPNVNIKSK